MSYISKLFWVFFSCLINKKYFYTILLKIKIKIQNFGKNTVFEIKNEMCLTFYLYNTNVKVLLFLI